MINQEYVKLSDHLPLDTPFTLMIDPANACNFKCSFCPTGDRELLKLVNRPLGIMDFDVFKKIIDDLTEFPRKVRSLRLFKDGEPFVNKNIINMIDYAKKKNIADEIYIISNGSLIDKKYADGLLDSGLDRLRISIEHVNAGKYKEITRTYSDYERIIENVRYIYEEKRRRGHHLYLNPKIVDTGLSEEELKKFKSDFGSISDELTIETLMGWSNPLDRDFTLGSSPQTGIDGTAKITEINVCPEPFKGVAVNFDGTVSVCCVDWSHGTLVGDTKVEKLIDIWNGSKLYSFRMSHLRGNKGSIAACANCQYLKGHKELSHLDEHKDELIQKFEKERVNGISI